MALFGHGVLADAMGGPLPLGLYLIYAQAGVITITLIACLVSSRWRIGGALAAGAVWFYLGMASFAVGHVTAFTLSLVAPGIPSSTLYLIHHTGALLALSLVSFGFWRVRQAVSNGSRLDLATFAGATLPFLAVAFVVLAAAGRGLPVPGGPMVMGGGMSSMDTGLLNMGGTDAMRELSQGVTLGNVGVDGAVLCMGLLAVALGSSLRFGGVLGRAVNIALVGVTALAVAYPATTLAAAFQPQLEAYLEMGLCFTVTCGFVLMVACISAARGLALPSFPTAAASAWAGAPSRGVRW
ncbi:MAG TPA: hypothetical protein VIG30_06125 [Ktedonobacterales bacterium]